MYNKNNNGPKTEPCGTPHTISCLSELTLLKHTYILLSLR